MKCFLPLFVVALVLIATQVRADEKGKTTASPAYPQPVLGYVETDATIARRIGSYCSIYPSEGRNLKANDTLVIIGTHQCERAYSSPTDFYEVAFRGKPYYVQAVRLKVSEDDLTRLKAMTEDEIQKYKDFALYATKRNWLESAGDAVKKLEKTAPYGVAILKASVYGMSEYTEGMGFSVTFFNTSKKTIKYITAHYVGYNAVKDAVKDWRVKSSKLTLKGVGPIAPGTSATYTRDYAWMTNLVDHFDITELTIQYMDGSKKTIKKPDKVWLNASTYRILKEYNEDLSDNDDSKTEAAPAALATDAAPAPEITPAAVPAAR